MIIAIFINCLLAGLEALTGLSLITWSASFMFLEMSKFWEENEA